MYHVYFHFFVNEMQVVRFYQECEWKMLSMRLTLLLQHYIHFSFKSTVCLSESWRMKCMHKHDMHEQRDVDDFLVFEHVYVINLKG